MVVFVTHYHKGFHATNDVKIIHRYVPREVGELVVWYLWLVVPLVRHLEMSGSGPAKPSGPEPSGPMTLGRTRIFMGARSQRLCMVVRAVSRRVKTGKRH
jgi:hypothetical protein